MRSNLQSQDIRPVRHSCLSYASFQSCKQWLLVLWLFEAERCPICMSTTEALHHLSLHRASEGIICHMEKAARVSTASVIVPTVTWLDVFKMSPECSLWFDRALNSNNDIFDACRLHYGLYTLQHSRKRKCICPLQKTALHNVCT